MVAFSVGAGLLCRHQCAVRAAAAAAPPLIADANLSGLGGWLILVGIGLFGAVLRLLFVMGRSMGTFSLWKWQALTTPAGVSYHPAWGPLLTLELLGQITVLVLGLYMIVLFFQRRRIFPRWFIAMLLFNAIFVVGDAIGIQLIKTPSPAVAAQLEHNIGQVLVGCAIWVPYMLVSRRVKATFLR